MDQGEERLIAGVERGVFPISFALLVARSHEEQIQNLLMDAFDQGLITTDNFAAAKRLISKRTSNGQRLQVNGKKYGVQQLRKDIADATKQKNSFVREARTKENRFLTLVTGLDSLWNDQEFLGLIDEENIGDRPQLSSSPQPHGGNTEIPSEENDATTSD